MRLRAINRSRQRGVAVITALLLTTLAITIVASLFWQQQVQVRSIENQRAQLQKQWILRGAIDWARLILREDGRNSSTDNLDEPWAVPLAETPLDQYVETGQTDLEGAGVTLSGSMVDAQARYNLTNLCPDGVIKPAEVVVFARLLDSLHLNPSLALTTANAIAAAKSGATQDTDGSSRQIGFAYVEDLLAVPGMTPKMVAMLKDYVVILPRATPLNVNTAPVELIAARIDGLTSSDAVAIVSARQQAYFRDGNDFVQRFPGKPLSPALGDISVSSNFFIVSGRVRLNRGTLEVDSLVERNKDDVRVIWVRDS